MQNCLKLYAHGFSFRSRPLIPTSPETIVLSIGTIETKFREEESDTAVRKIPLNWEATKGFLHLLQQNSPQHFLFLLYSKHCVEFFFSSNPVRDGLFVEKAKTTAWMFTVAL